MKVHRVAIATLISLLSSSSSPSSISLCNGLSASKPNNNNRRKSSFTAKIVEDVVVQEVSAKVNRSSKPKPLNARQKSFSQRDPIISLNMNLDYVAKSGQKDAAKRCEEMLLRIEALHEDGYYEKAPDVVSYNSVINSYAQGKNTMQNNMSRSGNAKRLMKRMEENNIKPNTVTWNTLRFSPLIPNAFNAITWLESIPHPGAPGRLALSRDGDDKMDSFESCILLDHIPHDEYFSRLLSQGSKISIL